MRPLLLVERLRHALRWAKAFRRQRGVPPEGVVLADQHIGKAIAGQIDEPQVRVAPIDRRHRLEWCERLPVRVLRSFEVSRRRSFELHQRQIAVTGKAQQLLLPAAECR